MNGNLNTEQLNTIKQFSVIFTDMVKNAINPILEQIKNLNNRCYLLENQITFMNNSNNKNTKDIQSILETLKKNEINFSELKSKDQLYQLKISTLFEHLKSSNNSFNELKSKNTIIESNIKTLHDSIKLIDKTFNNSLQNQQLQYKEELKNIKEELLKDINSHINEEVIHSKLKIIEEEIQDLQNYQQNHCIMEEKYLYLKEVINENKQNDTTKQDINLHQNTIIMESNEEVYTPEDSSSKSEQDNITQNSDDEDTEEDIDDNELIDIDITKKQFIETMENNVDKEFTIAYDNDNDEDDDDEEEIVIINKKRNKPICSYNSCENFVSLKKENIEWYKLCNYHRNKSMENQKRYRQGKTIRNKKKTKKKVIITTTNEISKKKKKITKEKLIKKSRPVTRFGGIT